MTSLGRLSAIAVGCGDYEGLQRLSGPPCDLRRLRRLLVEDRATAAVPEARFNGLADPTGAELRQAISDYALSRTAPNDVLVFYFSGHAVPVGYGDLGLCLRDTRYQKVFGTPISTDLVRVTDLVETLAAAKVDPIFILDACFSGTAGGAIERVYLDVRRAVQAEVGSTYALLASSRRIETTPDTRDGGPFTNALIKTASAGRADGEYKTMPRLPLKALFAGVRGEMERVREISPQLYCGDSLPDLGLVKNCKFRKQSYSFTKGQRQALIQLYDNGRLTPIEPAKLYGHGSTAYTTYRKLESAPAWGLLRKQDDGKITLTARGEQFVKGEMAIARKVEQDPETGEWNAAEGSSEVRVNDSVMR